ncbi:alkaline phosphatase D family protein [uncultured Abyssibacter sp.]|uniref:alkaline phosphatase D family protein n=1 Tax=uncultured Abyssibacter sp. TaxID=2320202 RepID=UPI0032B25B74
MDRRSFLRQSGLLTGATLVPVLSGCGESSDPTGREPPPTGVVAFKHGVASGDPLTDRVILWTRVTPGEDGPVTVRYQVATDPALQAIVVDERVVTTAERDYTVKVDPVGLSPGTTYYYRFEVGDVRSPIGRTKTLPSGAVDRLRFAFTSCSNYPAGYFNAYRHMAARADLDAVFHLGDFLYESGSTGGLGRAHAPDHEIVTLTDYRQRHAQYKTDPDLQALQRQHPMICVWDDHESTNDSWSDGAQNHTEGEEGVWAERKAIAIQVFFEWMPIRLVDPADDQRIWRQFTFGDLVDLLMLDTRLYGRDEQLPTPPLNPVTLNDPSRQLLGGVQEAWLAGRLATSTARWKLLGQQVMFGQLRLASLPDLTVLGITLAEELLAINADQWDGYPAARDRVFDMIEANAQDDIVVLTGDIHSSWGIELYRDPGQLLTLLDNIVGDPVDLGLIKALGVEFVTPSVTSSGFPAGTTPLLQAAFNLVDPHIKYFEGELHGYVLLDITHERTQGEWWYVDSITDSASGEYYARGLYTLTGENHLRRADGPTDARPGAPALAP